MNTIITIERKANAKAYSNHLKLLHTVKTSLCKKVVRNGYITNSIKQTGDVLFISQRPLTVESRSGVIRYEINGFAILMKHNQKLYIDVICANSTGRLLMEEIETYAKGIGIRYIQLSALPSAINAYRRMGFIHSDMKCIEDTHIAQRAGELKHLRFQNVNEATSHTDFKKLLSLLIKEKLVSDKKCRTVFKCSENGFTMTKCLN